MLKKFKTILRSGIRKSDYRLHTAEISHKIFELRAIVPEDIKDLIQLERAAYAGETPWTKSAFLAELYSRYKHQYICALYQGKIVAFTGNRIIFDDVHITQLAVDPEFQKMGIGSFLLSEAETFARQHRCLTLSLEVRLSNIDAQRLYRSVGYETVKRLENYYSSGNEDALYMVKRV